VIRLIVAYLEIAKKLEQAGAGALIICANTPHMVYDFVQPKITIPILHIADAVGQEAQKKSSKTRPFGQQTYNDKRFPAEKITGKV